MDAISGILWLATASMVAPATPAECHGRPWLDAPVAARSEVLARPLVLPPSLDAQIQDLRRQAWTAEESGRDDEAERAYEAVWQLLPEPRSDWNSSFVIANDAVDFHFDRSRWDDALRWLARAHLALADSQNSNIVIWLGKIRYRQGMLDVAHACFDSAYREWGERIFGGGAEDAEYAEFYFGGDH